MQKKISKFCNANFVSVLRYTGFKELTIEPVSR